jgi:hypothetical protein
VQDDAVVVGDITNSVATFGSGLTVDAGDVALVVFANRAAGVLDSGMVLGWHWEPTAPLVSDATSNATDGAPGVLFARAEGVGALTPEATWVGQTTVDSYHWYGQAVQFAGEPEVPPPPDPGIGLDVYDPDDVYLATLGNAKDVKIRIELNGTGWGRFTINRHDPVATEEVLKAGNYVRATIPQIDADEPTFGFFLEGPPAPEQPTEVVVSYDEEGGEDITWAGRGSMSYWDRAMWLADSFLVPWWPAYFEAEVGPPPSNAIGAVALNGPRTYYHYTVSGSTVTGRASFNTDDFTAWYDTRREYTRADGSKITLVHLIAPSVYAGYYVQPSGPGVVDYRKRSVYALAASILMQNIGTGTKPGEVLYAMYQESQAADRPIHPLPRLTVDFDDTTDSNGDAWATTDALAAVSAELGDDYLSTIAKLVNTGSLDVYMDPDLVQHAYNLYGRDLHSSTFAAGKVRFQKGVNIADDLVRDLTDQPVGTWAEVIGSEDGAIARVDLPSAAGRPPREVSVHGDSTDTAALEALGLAELAVRLLHSDAVGFGAATPRIGHEDELAGLYLPGRPGSARGNYWIGDLVTLHTGTEDHDFDEVVARIAAINIYFDDGGNLRAEPEVGSGFGGLASSSMGSGSSSGPTAGGMSSGASSGLSDLYQLKSERDQLAGYAGLDDDGLVPAEELAVAWKPSVRLASTAAETLASLVPGASFGGDTLAEGDDILLMGQASAAANGVRTVAASGAPLRRVDMDAAVNFLGAVVLVREGTWAGRAWRCTNLSEPVLETTALSWAAWPRAEDVPIADAGGHYTATDVEGALQELPKARVTTTDPTTGDDSADGYSVLSRWINITSGEEFVAVDVTVGAAVWTSTTAAGAGSLPSPSAVGDLVVWNGSAWVTLAAGTDGDVLTADSGASEGLSYQTPTGGGGGTDPWQIIIDPFAAHSHTNFDSLIGSLGDRVYGAEMESTGAVNAERNWDFGSPGGTWTIQLLHFKGSNRGIYTVQIDGSSVGTIDGYTAGSTANVRDLITGVSIAAGKRTISLKMLTKNASSSNYFGTFSGLTLLRTA